MPLVWLVVLPLQSIVVYCRLHRPQLKVPEEERPKRCHAIEVDSDVNPGSSLRQIKPSGLLFFILLFCLDIYS